MAHDKDLNLIPLMLSDLIRVAQAEFDKCGDVPVFVETCMPGYEFNEDHSFPVSDPPRVKSVSALQSYWRGKFSRAFVLDGGG